MCLCRPNVFAEVTKNDVQEADHIPIPMISGQPILVGSNE